MVHVCGITTAVLFTLMGLVHLYWAAGGSVGKSVPIPERDGRPTFRPRPAGTAGVAGLLFAAALVVLARLGLGAPSFLERWAGWGTGLLAVVFGLRSIGDFRLVGFFKQVRGTTFARWDSWLFSPLCVVIALGCAVVAAAGSSRRLQGASRVK
jgi:hypothetical protein